MDANVYGAHAALEMARRHHSQFTSDFLAYLPDNLHVYDAFEAEALRVAARGYRHYSARTIIEVLRHQSALRESGSAWKLNDHNTPYLARLFALMRPGHAHLFEFRVAKAARRSAMMDLARYIGSRAGAV